MLARIVPPLAAIVVCLLIALLALGWLVARKESLPVSKGISRVAEVVWKRSILPSPPRRRALRVGEARAPESYRSWIQTLLAATPILLTGLAVALAFRASVLNIGAEGQYVAGAIVATIIGLYLHSSGVVILTALLIGGVIAGAAFAALAAILRQWRDVPV